MRILSRIRTLAICPFYCRSHYPSFTRRPDDIGNLCLACFHCNRRESFYISGIDLFTGEEVPLFHPRKDRWNEHFIWSSDKLSIIGLTPTGRATVVLLELNRERAMRIRAADIVVGRHPSEHDNIQQET